MGFLLDLVRRWFGPKTTQETPRARPTPPLPPDRDFDGDQDQNQPIPPIVSAGLPWLAPAEPSYDPSPAEPVESIAAPAPLAVEPEPVPPIEIPPPPPPPPPVEPPAPPTPPEPIVEALAEPDVAEPTSDDPALEAPPVEPDESTPVEPVEVAEAPAPLGLTGDLDSPLWGDWGAIDLTPPAATPDLAPAVEPQAEGAGERRATDIRYLGRGVSEALDDHRGDRARLARGGLPTLDSPGELAERLGISIPRLRWLAFHAEVATRVHYVGFEVAKKGGGTRQLSAPHRSLALVQRWIFAEIVTKLPPEPEAHGFVVGRSIATNAEAHAGRAVVVNLDLEGFFPSIGCRRVRAVFERAGYSPALATVLGLLCTEAPRRVVQLGDEVLHVATGPRGLPQGACTSPGLSNQVARGLDRRLAGLAAKLGATYTRYADDLTFSGGPDLDPKVGYLMATVRRIAASEGFAVNEGKTRVLRRNARQVVTGLVVNDRPGVVRDEVRRLRAILHRARVEGLDAQNRAGHPDFRAYLLGKIAFVNMVRPDVGARLLAAYRAVAGG